MAFENFIPTIWNEKIERDLDRLCVYVEDCNRQYEGQVKQKGDEVRILGVGKPTIKSIARKNAGDTIEGPEDVEESSVTMKIDQIRYFNYKVGDIDKAQEVGGIMDALSKETNEGLANEEDLYISKMVADSSVKPIYDAPVKIVAGEAAEGEKNVLDALDEAIQVLYEEDVSPNTEIVATVSPRFYTLFKRAYIGKDTDNSEMMKNGKVAKYGNVTVKMSNNVAKTADGTTDNIMIRTKRAIAFVHALSHTEAYRPDNMFADAVKGFILFGGKIVRPKEVKNLNVKYA